MKSRTDYITLEIPSKMAFVNITPKVEEVVRRSGVKEGIVLANSMHITSSVFINDDERGLHRDFGVWLEELAPFNPDPDHYHHNRTGEDNADAHLKRTLMGHQVIIPITDGRLDLGPWEQVFYAEFDGQRRKRVIVKVMGAVEEYAASTRGMCLYPPIPKLVICVVHVVASSGVG